jgi:hypothetical protein
MEYKEIRDNAWMPERTSFHMGEREEASHLAHPGQAMLRTRLTFYRGQYSDAVIDELESQNDDQVGAMSARVKMLKDVSVLHSSISSPSHAVPDRDLHPQPPSHFRPEN